MNKIATKLGLAAEACEDSVLEAVTTLQNRVTELTPHEEENKTLKNRIAAFDTEQIAGLLDLHGVKEEKVRNRLTKALEPMKNREDRVAALIDFGFKQIEAKADKGNAARLLNRQDGNGGTQEVSAADEQALAQKAEAEINDYKIRNRGCTYAEARNVIRTSKPELFGLAKK